MISYASPHFELSVDGVELPPHRCAFIILPGDTVSFSISAPAAWTVDTGTFLSGTEHTAAVRWIAPRSHGIYTLTLQDSSGTTDYAVMIPIETSRWRTTSMNSFQIGSYGDGNQRDNLPTHFFEITSSTYSIPVSTHLKIGDFLCHIDGNYPQYLALDMELVDKLEVLASAIRQMYPGITKITCISGFRTPLYNAQIGNTTTESLHLYGMAADIWIECMSFNGLMDDFDRNKRVDYADGDYLIDIIQELEDAGLVSVGGASSYRWNRLHGPYIHIDVRGYTASWQTARTLE